MSTKYYILVTIFLLLIQSCKKEMVFFDIPPTHELEPYELLKINDKTCFFEASSNTFVYSTDQCLISEFIPFIEYNEHTEMYFNNHILQNHETNNLGTVEINKPYPIYFITEGIKSSFQLYFTPLPLVQINTLDEIVTEPKVFGRIVINYPEQEINSYNSMIGVEYRGASSCKQDKKSFGFKLINGYNLSDTISSSFFDMKLGNKWILDAMSVDKALLRNKTSFEIWNCLSGSCEHIGIKSKFVIVFYNSQCLGIYCFNENITGEFLSLTDESVLIVGKDNTKVTHFEDFPTRSANSDYWNKWQQKYPDPDILVNWNTFEALSSLIVTANDDEFSKEIFNKIDQQNVIDYYLFVSLFYGYDNLGKNWFFMQQSPNEKFEIIPWDLDGSWGRNHRRHEIDFDKQIKNGLFLRLLEVNPSGYRTKLKERWKELRNNEFSEKCILNKFENNFDILDNAKAFEIENEIWNEDLNLTEEKNYIYSWTSERLKYLDRYFNELE